MIAVAPQMRIWVACAPVDFRCGIDRLAQTCRSLLSADPLSGAVFVFRNRKATAIKVLAYDSQGFWLCHKRLSSGKFRHWPQRASVAKVQFLWHELSVLLSGGHPSGAQAAPCWRAITEGGPYGRASSAEKLDQIDRFG
jgi:transposase